MRLIYFLGFFNLVFQSIAGTQVRSIRPDATDHRIKSFTSDSHYILTPEPAKQRNLLVVHLAASFHKSNESSHYLHLAAREGYHVISLAYPGVENMYSRCEHSTDPPCYENFHREVVEGKNYSPWIEVDTFESVLFRLRSLLSFLKLNFPLENWSQYQDAQDNLLFSRITWSGHSDGAGHAAVIAKYFSVNRVLCFSGPKDFSLHYYLPPIWVHTGIWKTDRSKIFAFAHTSDEFVFQKEIWDSLGLNKYGQPVNVGSNPFPYKSSHQLITSYPVSIPDSHGSTLLNERSPKMQGKYIFETVWKYMLDIDEASTPIKVEPVSNFVTHPNPIQRGGQLFIIHNPDIQRLALFDQNGVKIQEYMPDATGFVRLQSNLAAGCYFLRGKSRKGSVFSSIIVY